MRRTNILTDSLPETVIVDGREFPIESDFRAGIQFELTILDKKMTDKEKFKKVMEVFYGNTPPHNKSEALKAIIGFYKCQFSSEEHKPEEKTDEEEKTEQKPPKRIYDFKYDDGYIYAAFLQQYGIDLTEARLHWWRFMALFKALTEDTLFVKIMGYRSADTSKIKNRTDRERIMRLKQVYALPLELSHEEKLDMVGAAFGGG